MGKVATSPLPSLASLTLSAGTKVGNCYVAHMWAKWLLHPCRLRGSPTLSDGRKKELAKWPKCGQSGSINPAVLEVSNAQRVDNNRKWLCGPHVGRKLLRGPHVGKMATSPLPSWGAPTLSAGTTITNGYVAPMWAKRLHHPCRVGAPQRSSRGQQSQMAMWSTCGQTG